MRGRRGRIGSFGDASLTGAGEELLDLVVDARSRPKAVAIGDALVRRRRAAQRDQVAPVSYETAVAVGAGVRRLAIGVQTPVGAADALVGAKADLGRAALRVAPAFPRLARRTRHVRDPVEHAPAANDARWF